MKIHILLNTIMPLSNGSHPIFIPSLSEWKREELFQAGQEISLWVDQITSQFAAYLRTGGFPRSIRDEVEHGRVKQDIYKLYRDAFVGDLARLGRRESLLRELVQWIINRRENPFDWSQAARETQLGTHPTVREYVEDAEAAFLWNVLFKLRKAGGRKVVFGRISPPRRIFSVD